MRQQLCASCGKEYDKSAFGAGYKYCTKQCKYTKAGTVSMELRYKGRNRRFPRVSYEEMCGILAQLKAWGIEIRPKYQGSNPFNVQGSKSYKYSKFDTITRVYTARIGMMDIPISIGGVTNQIKRSHVAIFHDAGVLTFASTCSKVKSFIEVADGLKTKTIKRLTPCFRPFCHKCSNAKFLRDYAERVALHHEAEPIDTNWHKWKLQAGEILTKIDTEDWK